MSNRLKPIILYIVSLEQSGFVEGRQIMDGVILVHEVIHSLKVYKETEDAFEVGYLQSLKLS